MPLRVARGRGSTVAECIRGLGKMVPGDQRVVVLVELPRGSLGNLVKVLFEPTVRRNDGTVSRNDAFLTKGRHLVRILSYAPSSHRSSAVMKLAERNVLPFARDVFFYACRANERERRERERGRRESA